MASIRFAHGLAALLLTLLAACGGGGGGNTDVAGGGIGGTGISNGPITATGTVAVASSGGPVAASAVTTSATSVPWITVNGVVYAVPGQAAVTVNGAAATGADLRVGQVVTVAFTVDATTGTATAGAVTYAPELSAPVEAVDPANGTITLLGQVVRVDTLLDAEGEDGMDIDLADLSPDDLLEISGERDADGLLHATRIERKGHTADPTTTAVAVEGSVAELALDHFVLDNLTVRIPPFGVTIAGSLANGVRVAVQGQLSNSTTLTASRIEVQESPVAKQEEDSAVELKGFVTAADRRDSDDEITVDGVVVRLTPATEIRGEEESAASRADLRLNVEVEVEGRADGNGAVVAERITLEG